jgi:hypothetical protein
VVVLFVAKMYSASSNDQVPSVTIPQIMAVYADVSVPLKPDVRARNVVA